MDFNLGSGLLSKGHKINLRGQDIIKRITEQEKDFSATQNYPNFSGSSLISRFFLSMICSGLLRAVRAISHFHNYNFILIKVIAKKHEQ